MDRRDALAGIGLAGAALLTARTAQADHHGHHAGSQPTLKAHDWPALKKVAQTTAECQAAGEACIRHCTQALAAGHAAMGPCNAAVHNMHATVVAMRQLATYATASKDDLKAMAAACARMCKACAAACKPHAGHHAECKACMEACETCVKACEALAA